MGTRFRYLYLDILEHDPRGVRPGRAPLRKRSLVIDRNDFDTALDDLLWPMDATITGSGWVTSKETYAPAEKKIWALVHQEGEHSHWRQTVIARARNATLIDVSHVWLDDPMELLQALPPQSRVNQGWHSLALHAPEKLKPWSQAPFIVACVQAQALEQAQPVWALYLDGMMDQCGSEQTIARAAKDIAYALGREPEIRQYVIDDPIPLYTLQPGLSKSKTLQMASQTQASDARPGRSLPNPERQSGAWTPRWF